MNRNPIIIYLIIFTIFTLVFSVEIDPLGYILYCPCMGRFGNQADHFLGALGFAHGLNRTLVLPPWIEYKYGQPKSDQIPFDTYFKISPLETYQKVITMEQFMKEIAPIEWPPDRRISFCYATRGSNKNEDCNAKEGNPFGPFWDNFNVDFAKSELFGPLHYDTYHHNMARQWQDRYPPSRWPVIAFTGAPATFPVQLENRDLHKYLIWSDNISNKADHFIKTVLPKGAFISIHLRNGIDWVRACQHIPYSPNLFSSAQCMGYRNEKGKVTAEMCLPSKETIIRQLKRAIKKVNSVNNNSVKSVFVASDANHMLDDLNDELRRLDVKVFKLDESNPHVDLAIMGRSNYFIGNCVSSFSAFVKRERDAHAFPSTFWAFPPDKSTSKATVKDEL